MYFYCILFILILFFYCNKQISPSGINKVVLYCIYLIYIYIYMYIYIHSLFLNLLVTAIMFAGSVLDFFSSLSGMHSTLWASVPSKINSKVTENKKERK